MIKMFFVIFIDEMGLFAIKVLYSVMKTLSSSCTSIVITEVQKQVCKVFTLTSN